jgi:glycosyltransferase involved in cell wall biosynthesis
MRIADRREDPRRARPTMPAEAPIRVARVLSRLNIGGPSRHVILLTAGLNDDRFRSTLIVGREDAREGHLFDDARAHGVEPIRLPALRRDVHPLDDGRALLHLLRLFRRLRPQIVHTHASKAGALGRLAARLTGVPIVVHTFHGHTFHSYFHPLLSTLFRALERALARWTTRIVTISPTLKEELIRYRIAPAEKIVVIPLGLELERFISSDRFRGELRRQFGWDETIPVICSVGRLVPVKNHALLLRAFGRVLHHRPEARLLLVGDGELRPRLEALSERLSVRHRVVFLGWRDDLERIYADADLVVNSSLNEGTPVAVIEAMAAARPVIATSVGGTPDLIRHGETGWLVPPEDPDALAARILHVLDHPDEAARVARAAQAFALAHFRADQLIRRTRELYLSLLASPEGKRATHARQ